MTNISSERPIYKNSFETASWSDNRVVCGLDEVGRGSLAGPLVTAAVILPVSKEIDLLKDSKILPEKERAEAYCWIVNNSWYAIGIVDHHTIDRYNIWHATLIAMKKALMHVLASCPHMPVSILIDAMPLKLSDTSYNSVPVYYFDKGESKSCSIAAASIVAKVTRDNLMKKLDSLFPGFYLGDHKGYGTKKHTDVLKEKSPLIIHRRSFLHNIDLYGENEDEYGEQQTICGSY